MENFNKKDALSYHSEGRAGKIEVISTKPTQTKRDLSLAYSPGVAEPCKEIANNIDDVYKYTAKGNLVAVISNGTAVLGLGDLGPEASKPVMEGKGVLFKIFADIDVFDIELNCTDVNEFVKVVKALEPTFGGINLEDIKAPESFEIESILKKELKIPIMHDDQHGTAIISGAGLINALKIANKKIEEVRMVVNGAGASAIACSKLFISLGLKKENLIMLDSKGVINKNRKDLDKYKSEFITNHDIETLEQSLIGADVFIGLSKGNILSPEMILSMASNPIVFAMANPDPEIAYDLAIKTRPDIILATGRSDHPNQVNNVLGFPFIFRGALDVRATTINEEMKLAAVHAIANLALEPVPEIVNIAYNNKNLCFGKNYIIPKPIDPRLLTTVAPAVAKAAMDSGVAKNPVQDWDKYVQELNNRLGNDNSFVRSLIIQAKQDPKRVVFAEADNYKILKAIQTVIEEKIAIPVLLGNKEKIERIINENNIELPENLTIIDPRSEQLEKKRIQFGKKLYEKRARKGMNEYEAIKLMRDRNYFGSMLVESGEADALISGLTRNYPNVIKPALQCIGIQNNTKRVAGMYIMITKKGPLFFADTTVNINPGTEELVEITKLVHEEIRRFNVTPRIAMLSYSNFGSANGETPQKVAKAVSLLHKNHPEIIVDGDIQANMAVNTTILKENFPFSKLTERGANTFIFPNLESGNICYKMLQSIGNVEAIGPIVLGFKNSVHILQLGSSVREIINMVAIATVDAQNKAR